MTTAPLHRISWAAANVAGLDADGTAWSLDSVHLVVVNSRIKGGWYARCLEQTTGTVLRDGMVTMSGVKQGVASITLESGEFWQADRVGGCASCGEM